MARKTDLPDQDDIAVLDSPPTRETARDRFINRCLHDWGRDQFLADRGCDPNKGHVDKLVEKASRLFDRLFADRPVTSNL